MISSESAPILKEEMRRWQEGVYADPSLWHNQVVISLSKRLRIATRYSKLMELYGVVKDEEEFIPNLTILDVGCGNGFLSAVLSLFGKVYAFDYSKEGINIAKKLLGSYSNIHFFEGDGEYPKNLTEIKDEKFDAIVMRSFHPLYKNIIDKRKPLDIIFDYYAFLKENGIIIIEYPCRFNSKSEEASVTEYPRIVKSFKAKIINTYSLDLLLCLNPLFRLKKEHLFRLSGTISGLESVLCRLRSIDIIRTMIISKNHGEEAQLKKEVK